MYKYYYKNQPEEKIKFAIKCTTYVHEKYSDAYYRIDGDYIYFSRILPEELDNLFPPVKLICEECKEKYISRQYHFCKRKENEKVKRYLEELRAE